MDSVCVSCGDTYLSNTVTGSLWLLAPGFQSLSPVSTLPASGSWSRCWDCFDLRVLEQGDSLPTPRLSGSCGGDTGGNFTTVCFVWCEGNRSLSLRNAFLKSVS